jgi:hypothetical protein
MASKGSVLFGSVPRETGGKMPNYLTLAETLEGTKMDAVTIWKRLQVKIGPNGPRKYIGVYRLRENTDCAFSRTTANVNYGPGGYPQVYIENPSLSLELIDEIPLELP